jgi:hypothetical protein
MLYLLKLRSFSDETAAGIILDTTTIKMKV